MAWPRVEHKHKTIDGKWVVGNKQFSQDLGMQPVVVYFTRKT